MDDLLGPANGPNKLIKDMSVRDRYLVGKLAPRETLDEGNDWGNSAVDEAEDVAPDDLEVKAKLELSPAGKRTKGSEQPTLPAMESDTGDDRLPQNPVGGGMGKYDKVELRIGTKYDRLLHASRHEHTKPNQTEAVHSNRHRIHQALA